MTSTLHRPVLRLPAPPPLRPREGGALMMALPALGGLGSVALVAFSGLSGSGGMRTRSLVAAGLFLVVTIAFVVLQVERQRRQRREMSGSTREDHLAHLARAREAVASARTAQLQRAHERHPAPQLLLAAPLVAAEAGSTIRVGTATGPLALHLELPEPVPGQPADVVARRALDRFVATHGKVAGLPVELDLGTTHVVRLVGDADRARSAARALVCSAARGRPASRLRIVLLRDRHAADAADAWEWLKWLPHHGSPVDHDAVGARRLVLEEAAGLRATLTSLRASGAHVLVIDDRHPSGAATSPAVDSTLVEAMEPASVPEGVTLLRITGACAETTETTLLLDPAGVRTAGRDTTPPDFTVDGCDIATASAFARRLAAVSPADDDLLTLIGREPRVPLRIPVGTDASGAAVHLDLREPSLGGHGPHGLLIGATGSGKSELLRTLVTGLALTCTPEELNLVLVDFKGGATFAGLAALPHTAGLVTNLAADLALVDRLQDALAGEVARRQQLLRDADATSAAELPGLPSLLVVVDEFTELLGARPELAELFAGIGRVGRSLGVHLLLASQRLDEGRLRGLESHLGYRIALRTFSTAESRAVIGVPDAHDLPAAPGTGILATGPESRVRFQACLVSAPGRPRVECEGVLPFTAAWVDPADVRISLTPPLLDRAVDGAREQAGPGRSARQLWLPPLSTSPRLPDLLAVRPVGDFRLPVGLVDLPREQRHEPLLLDLAGSAGHVAVVGAPRTGRTTLLHTITTAITTTDATARCAVLDLGGELAPLATAPGITAHVGRSDADAIRALVRELTDEATRRRSHRSADDPEVYVVVDGWSALRERWPDVEHDLVGLAQESLAVGIHLVLTATRWADLRPSLRDVTGTRLELRLGDAADSVHGRHRAGSVPTRPGHGLTPDGHHFLAAIAESPVSDGRRP